MVFLYPFIPAPNKHHFPFKPITKIFNLQQACTLVKTKKHFEFEKLEER